LLPACSNFHHAGPRHLVCFQCAEKSGRQLHFLAFKKTPKKLKKTLAKPRHPPVNGEIDGDKQAQKPFKKTLKKVKKKLVSVVKI
jgi:hypothetical protein